MQLEINVETLLPTAEGSSGIVLEVGGLEIATPLPSFRSRRRGTLEEDACEPWLEIRAVTGLPGTSYVVHYRLLALGGHHGPAGYGEGAI